MAAELDDEPLEDAAVVGAGVVAVAALVAAVVTGGPAVVPPAVETTLLTLLFFSEVPVVDLFFREVIFWVDGRLMDCSSSLVYLDHIRIEKVGS